MIFTILFLKKIKQIFKSNFMYKKIILKLFRKRILKKLFTKKVIPIQNWFQKNDIYKLIFGKQDFYNIMYKESYSNSNFIYKKILFP